MSDETKQMVDNTHYIPMTAASSLFYKAPSGRYSLVLIVDALWMPEVTHRRDLLQIRYMSDSGFITVRSAVFDAMIYQVDVSLQDTPLPKAPTYAELRIEVTTCLPDTLKPVRIIDNRTSRA